MSDKNGQFVIQAVAALYESFTGDRDDVDILVGQSIMAVGVQAGLAMAHQSPEWAMWFRIQMEDAVLFGSAHKAVIEKLTNMPIESVQ